MSWGIDFKADIYISREDFQENIHQVNDKIDELEDDNKTIEKRLLSLAMLRPTDYASQLEEGIDFLAYIDNEISDYLQWKAENDVKLYQLGLYKDYLNGE